MSALKAFKLLIIFGLLAAWPASSCSALPLPQTLTQLREISQQPLITQWRQHLGDVEGAAALDFNDSKWETAKPSSKGDIHWGAGQSVIWLRQRIVIPQDWHGYPSENAIAHLNLIWWAQKAEIYLDGRFVQGGDLYDAVQRVPLGKCSPGQTILVALRLVSPGHDTGALTQSRLDIEAPKGKPDPGRLADELQVVDSYLKANPTPKLRSIFNWALTEIDWAALHKGQLQRFELSLASARKTLLPTAALTHQREIHILSQSHIDMAWLWPVPETHQVIEKTFRSTLGLMAEDDQLHFAQGSAQAYAWIEQEHPQLFKQIQAKVKAGRWELVGGMWVEPDLNLPDGESLVRQVLYGKQYFQSRFGQDVHIGWNPDSFGYTWQLPQIYKKSGIDFFLTQKLDWNDTTKFPHRIFWWEAPDGSKVLTYFSTPLGEQIDGVKMATKAIAYEKNTGFKKLLWLYGVGDHGGGPTRDMLQQAQRWQQSPVFPKLVQTTANQYFQELLAADHQKAFPTWKNELYLEFHRGTYTVHADQKRQNRQQEVLLTDLEKLSSAASFAGQQGYPQRALEGWWKTLLFNQFHDILPGSAITAVYAQANQERQQLTTGTQGQLSKALAMLARTADTQGSGIPVVVFNSLGSVRSSVAKISLTDLPKESLVAVDRQENSVPVQILANGIAIFWARNIPGVGYKVFWLRKADQSAPVPSPLENTHLRVILDPATGNIASLFDKTTGKELLSAPGNQLQFFQDKGQYWDAWNIDPEYEKHPLSAAQLVGIETVETGSVRSVVRVTHRFQQSTFIQDLILYRDSPLLYIENRVDWQERHVLVKAAFPLKLATDRATYEIPFATIDRSTLRNTKAQKAQWEVPALRWASLSDGKQGFSLLNDSKYGYDARRNNYGTVLRLSLLRGPQWPDPNADLGSHQFTYALSGFLGDWRSSGTIQQGLDLNTPLMAVVESPHSGKADNSFLAIDNPQIVLTTWKQAEDGDGWVIRLYESTGKTAQGTLSFPKPLQTAAITDLLERKQKALTFSGEKLNISLSPYEIQTIRVRQ
jgi:alpha-mannosidase